MKTVIILAEGLTGQTAHAGQTALQAASAPNLDMLAQNGLFGLWRPTTDGGFSEAGQTVLSLLCAQEPSYPCTSALEAIGAGIELSPTDVTYRCSLVPLSRAATLEQAVFEGGPIEMSGEESAEIIEFSNERFHTARTHLFDGGSSGRHVFAHYDAQPGAVLTNPHTLDGKPVWEGMPRGQYAGLLRFMTEHSYEVLRNHPLNARRVIEGKPAASAVWFWEEGRLPGNVDFASRYHISGMAVSSDAAVRGAAQMAGLALPAPAGEQPDVQFVFVHSRPLEGTEGVAAVETFDQKVLAPVLEGLRAQDEEFSLLVLAQGETGSTEPAPFALWRQG